MNKLLKDTRKLAFMGVMLAVTIVLIALPTGGVILLGGAVSATVVHIPTIVTGIALGPMAGLVMGFSFGLVTLIRAAVAPLGPLDPLFVNPLLSILPRLTIGVVAYYAYRATAILLKDKDKKKTIASTIGAIFGSISNTFFVMLMLYLIYAKEVVEMFSVSFKVFLASVLGFNAALEVFLSALVTVPIVIAYRAMRKQ